MYVHLPVFYLLEQEMILIVEDNEHERYALAALLATFDYESKSVASAEDALAVALDESFIAVLMDIALPGMSGVECTVELKNMPGFKAPIIGLTGSDDEDIKTEGLKAGMVAYLVKPFNSEELRKLLLRHVYDAKHPNLKTLKPIR
jgi:CheY-like chemotaxis protein